MKISIILVCLNSKKYISSALSSIVTQSYKDLELIVIDGGSIDGTLDIILSYKKYIDIFISEPDEGIYYAMNKGIKYSSGDIIGFLNSDDYYASSNTLSEIINIFKSGSYDCCYSDLIYVSNTDEKIIKRFWSSINFNLNHFFYGISPPHPTFYITRKLLTNVGFFNTRYKLASDFDFMFRCLINKKARSYYINKVLVHMRDGGATNRSFKNIILQNMEIIDCIKSSSNKFSIIKFIYNKFKFKLDHY